MRRILPVLAALALGLTGCSDAPAKTAVDPVPLTMKAPTYAAATKTGLLLRSGDATHTVLDAMDARWLPDGRALVRAELGTRIWDPRADRLGPPLPLAADNRSVTQLNTINEGIPATLVAFSLDGTPRWTATLPVSDHPDAGKNSDDVNRQYLSAHTIDGTTFLRWADGSEAVDDGDYGLLMVGPDGKVGKNVQVNTPIIATWLAADGSALLATRRTRGDPCGGCKVTQRLIELDPKTGDTVATHDFPDAYEKQWAVREVDKVDGKVAVRFEETVFSHDVEHPTQSLVQRGTWVLDDGWTMVPGSDKERSWWQGPRDRVVAVPLPVDEDGNTGYRWRFVWEHDGKRTPLPGANEADGPGGSHYYSASVPGQLIAPR